MFSRALKSVTSNFLNNNDWLQGFSLFVNKLVPFIDIWMRIRRPAIGGIMFRKHTFVERHNKRFNFDMSVLWLIVCSAGGATALKSQGLVSFERRAEIVRNKSRVIIYYQPLSSSHPETSLQAVPSNTMSLVYWKRDKFETTNRGEQIGSQRSTEINLYICVRAPNKLSNDFMVGNTRMCIRQSADPSKIESVSGLNVLLRVIVNTQTASLPVFTLSISCK